MIKPEVGKSYRFIRDFEVHDPKTGTLKHLLRKGEVFTVKKIDLEMDRIYLEGVPVEIPLDAIGIHIRPADVQK